MAQCEAGLRRCFTRVHSPPRLRAGREARQVFPGSRFQEEVLQFADPTPCSNSIGQCVEFRRDSFIAERMACSTGRCFNHLPLLTSIREHNCHLSCVGRVRLLVVLRHLVHVGFVDQVPHVVGFDPGVRKLHDERGTIQQGDRHAVAQTHLRRDGLDGPLDWEVI